MEVRLIDVVNDWAEKVKSSGNYKDCISARWDAKEIISILIDACYWNDDVPEILNEIIQERLDR